jgi:hypothetical protein
VSSATEPETGIAPLVDLDCNYTGAIWSMADIWPSTPGTHLHLITAWEYARLPAGQVLYSIEGERVTVGSSYIDTDTRVGYLAYGYLCSRTRGRKD